MKRLSYGTAALLMLAACGDPLAGLDRLSDVELAPESTVAQALPDNDEIKREGFFGTQASRMDVTQTERPVSPPRAGILGGLLRRATPERSDGPAATQVTNHQATEGGAQSSPADAAAPNAGSANAETVPRRGGLLAMLRPRNATQPPIRTVAPDHANDAGPTAQGESLPDRDTPVLQSGPDMTDVAYGTVLPFGQIARVCEARNKPMGRKVDKTGARGFTLYDSAPERAEAHTFYVTGYDDRCPRQFTAATALLGAPSLYELLRFSPAGKNLSFSDTDKAYDRLKSSICGASRNRPCGAKIGRLDKTTAFISAYEVFGNTSRRAEFLVHDGATLAAALKYQ